MNSLVAVGACYLDTILTVSHYPTEDSKLRASTLSHRRGGNVPNTLEVLQKLLLLQPAPSPPPPLYLLSVLPSSHSPASQQIASSLAGPNVSLAHCLHREAFTQAPSSYVIRSQSNDSRTIVNYNELPEMTVEEFVGVARELEGKARVYHFEGRNPDVTRECIVHLRQTYPDVKVSVEIEKPGRMGLGILAKMSDVAFFSQGWVEDSSGYKTPQSCLRHHCITSAATHMFCTWGDKGAYGIAKGLIEAHSDAWKPEGGEVKVVDTIGAGDTFIAGVLYAIFFSGEDWELQRIMDFANELAGRKVHQAGFEGLAERVADWL
ncbi:MAG: hypothetical protein Q9160_002524 [Pyrenula sp. 1 TL-2023]